VAGEVAAFDRSVRPLWTSRVGPVYRAPAVSADGRTVYVPSTDHHLYALDARNGRRRWTFRAADPVLSWPLVADIGGTECVLVSAGNALLAVNAGTGKQLWTADAGGFSAGRVACDGALVYRGGGDGHLRAFDTQTGRQAWDRALVTGDENHVLLYGPWDVALLLHAGSLVTSTVAGVWGIDPATGADRWTRTGGFMYPPAVPIPDDSAALLLTETGALSLVDLADGTARWDASLAVRVLNSGGVLRAETLWVQSVDGQLIGVNVTDGAESARFQNGTAYCFATPVTVGNTVVVADQDGFVRGISVE
jgi:outer membrane protein assembly factor BamB